MDQKFHINSSGDVRLCHATTRPCRFGESEHFTDRAEARQAVEARLSEEMSPLASVSKADAGSARKADDSKVSNSAFVSRVKELATNEKPTNAELQAIGAAIDDELRSRLDFDPFDHELSSDEIKAVQNANREIFSSLVKNGGDIPTVVTGPLAKHLHEAVRILPDNLKAAIGKSPIFTKAANKNNRTFDGRHRFGQIEQIVQSRDEIAPHHIPEGAPDGALIPSDKYASRMTIEEYNGFRVWEKNGNSTLVEERWIGDKPKNTRVRKIADQGQVYVDGQLMTLNKPVYAVFTEEKTVGSEISAKKMEDPNERGSVLLHEFSHAVQRRTVAQNFLDESESTMYEELAYGKEVYDSDYDVVKRQGFPNGYMAKNDGEEFLPVASEGFFHPSARDKGFLYGSDRGENADKVRQWVAGLWVSLGNQK